MSDSSIQGSSGGGYQLAMSENTRADMSARIDQFETLLASGTATKQDIMSGISNVISGTDTAIQNSYGVNTSGLNAESYKGLQGADDQYGRLKFKMINGEDVKSQLKDLTETFRSELKPEQGAAAQATSTVGGSSAAGSGDVQGQMLQLMQMLLKLMQQMSGQGADTKGDKAVGGALASGPDSPAVGSGPSASASTAPASGVKVAGGPAPEQGSIAEIMQLLQQMLEKMNGQGGARGAAKGALDGAGGIPAAQSGSHKGVKGSLSQIIKMLQQVIEKSGNQDTKPMDGTSSSMAPAASASGLQGVGMKKSDAPKAPAEVQMKQMMTQMMQMMMQFMQMMMQQMSGPGAGIEPQSAE